MIKHYILYLILCVALAISITLNITQASCFNTNYSLSFDPISGLSSFLTLVLALSALNSWKNEKIFELSLPAKKEIFKLITEFEVKLEIINNNETLQSLINLDEIAESDIIKVIAEMGFVKNKLKDFTDKITTEAITLEFIGNKKLRKSVDELNLLEDTITTEIFIASCLLSPNENPFKKIITTELEDDKKKKQRDKRISYIKDVLNKNTLEHLLRKIKLECQR
jgi:hypothetical protein